MPAEVSTKPPSQRTRKFDPFRPEMPQIPGVNSATETDVSNGANVAKARMVYGIATGVAILIVGIAFTWWAKSLPKQSTAYETSTNPRNAAGGTSSEAKPSPSLEVRPNVAASVKELAKPWAAKEFVFTKPSTHETVKAMIVRLPSGTLWAFGLQEPYGRCELEFVTDLKRLETQYGYRASHPMVANPCNNTIYDPLKISSSGNTWIRGDVVQGGGLRPPLSINVQTHGSSIIADRME